MLIFPCVLSTSVGVLTGTGQKTPAGMEATCRMCSWRCWILVDRKLQTSALIQTIRDCSFVSLGVKCFDNCLFHEIRLQAALDYLDTHRWECLQCIITQ